MPRRRRPGPRGPASARCGPAGPRGPCPRGRRAGEGRAGRRARAGRGSVRGGRRGGGGPPARWGVAEDLDPASARSIHPGEEAEERGLSGAVRADDPQRLARVDAQVHLVERLAPSPAQASAEYPPSPMASMASLGVADRRGWESGVGLAMGSCPRVGRHPLRYDEWHVWFVLSGASIGATHDIEGTTVLGRGGDADVVIPESSVSRRHARAHPSARAGGSGRFETSSPATGSTSAASEWRRRRCTMARPSCLATLSSGSGTNRLRRRPQPDRHPLGQFPLGQRTPPHQRPPLRSSSTRMRSCSPKARLALRRRSRGLGQPCPKAACPRAACPRAAWRGPWRGRGKRGG